MSHEQRRLAAILVADVVGFSRLVGADETGTLARLATLRRDIVDPSVARHAGRLFKQTGDGFLVEFASAVEAVACAIEIQKAAGQDSLPLRIGIHVGDVVVQGDDLMGDGVNIAARIEGIADAGGIAVSRQVHDQVRDRLAVAFDDRGEVALKNIGRPVHVFAVGGTSAPAAPALALPDKPSIAVLPFANMSGDPEQEYFTDGITEDIITELARYRQLFVIARNSSFTYKGKAVDVRAVARDLGVRYVLEGSVRKAGNRVRITGQLVQADTGAHIWAERYDGDLTDIFDLQDQVTRSVVGAIAPRLEQAEIERVRSKATENLGAYDLYLRGLARHYLRTREGFAEARQFGYRAIELDPDYAAAYALVAFSDAFLVGSGTSFSASDTAETARVARRAIELGGDDTTVLTMAAWALAHVVRDLGAASVAAARALELNPNLALASFVAGWTTVWSGRPEEAVGYFMRALRLSPRDPNAKSFRIGMAHAHFMAGDMAEAIRVSEPVMQDGPGPAATRIAAAANALAGHREEARRCLGLLLRQDPARRVSTLHEVLGPYRRSDDLARYREGLRLAGLPE